jgi:hypothetical protein
MLETYKATLRGNKIEWNGEIPKYLNVEENVNVYITILEESNSRRENKFRGQKMSEALEKLASINALAEIKDASEWQRKHRQDRSLPERDA